MSYRDFTLEQIHKTFGLLIEQQTDLFGTVEPVAMDTFFLHYLHRNIPLAMAINTEKAKSEMIVAPMLLELKARLPEHISLFSGTEFNVDPSTGLSGVCDFLISRSPQQLYITAPILTLVEAKNDNIKNGYAQCIAEMIAARIFNEREGNPPDAIYGAVTNGNQWKFLKLHANLVRIDTSDYYISDPQRILGIFVHMVQTEHNEVAICQP